MSNFYPSSLRSEPITTPFEEGAIVRFYNYSDEHIDGKIVEIFPYDEMGSEAYVTVLWFDGHVTKERWLLEAGQFEFDNPRLVT